MALLCVIEGGTNTVRLSQGSDPWDSKTLGPCQKKRKNFNCGAQQVVSRWSTVLSKSRASGCPGLSCQRRLIAVKVSLRSLAHLSLLHPNKRGRPGSTSQTFIKTFWRNLFLVNKATPLFQ